ncbi:hypothetical protein [Herbiconiux daphne]|uniref:Uncharacterized protein n=1 Tax=Herbiconiux daphne TaxID=2970914 RepID=A0ABT2GZQ3_9MICO|nr:hypothetical protein [Herbiconiux daphne]MCS5733440.1 hypothetical protein [Herbiconiux daphne]
MPSETFIATALPHSAADAPASGFHVSLFVTPRLVPDVAGEPLGDFAAFARWGDLLGGGEVAVTLVDQDGPIDCTLVPNWDAALWSRVFPPDLPVESNDPPDWSARAWASYPAAGLSEASKSIVVASTLAGPSVPPAPSRHPLFEPLRDVLRRLDVPFVDESEYSRTAPPVNEPAVTEALARRRGDNPSLAGVAWQTDEQGAPVYSADWVHALVADAYKARRFFEDDRSGAADVPPEPVPVAGPEFHRRVGFAGDHPDLLRRLGLVLDLRVADPGRLAGSQWIAAVVAVAGDESLSRSPRTLVRLLDDGSLIAEPDAARSAEWSDGRSALGNPEAFALMTVDPDGSALKTERFVMGLPRLARLERNGDDVTAAPPALRATGFAVARLRQDDKTSSQAERQRVLAVELDANPDVATAPAVGATDVMRGYRVEALDLTTGLWHSLHRRRTTLRLDDSGAGGEVGGGAAGAADVVFDDSPQEGFTQGTAARQNSDAPDATLHVHETVFGWDGWSLSAPRPGRWLRDELSRDAEGAYVVDEKLDAETPVPVEAPPDPFRFTHRVEPGSLPRLRFGRDYAFRAWGVDLAGNTREHVLDDWSDDPKGHLDPGTADAETLRAVTPPAPFLRWDPVPPPAIVPEKPYTEGESLRVVVLRSDVTQDRATGEVTVHDPVVPASARHLAPPKTSQLQAELHGRFDAALDTMGAGAPAARAQMLAWSLRESGSFFDDAVADATDPAAPPHALGYVSLHTEPGALRDGDVPTTLPGPNDVLAPGQYVVHDTEFAELPYLPDPLAAGVSLSFPPSRGESFRPVLSEAAVTVPYAGTWPFAEPFRLTLEATGPGGAGGAGGAGPGGAGSTDADLTARVDGRRIVFGLPAGSQQRFALSSSLQAHSLDLFGVWRALPGSFTAVAFSAARDGALWALTPAEELRLVYAVPRPVAAPRAGALFVAREVAAATATLRGTVVVHGSSTESLTAEARWRETVDDPAALGPVFRWMTDIGFTAGIDPRQTVAELNGRILPDGANDDGWALAEANHHFADTRFRRVTYRLRATTRFREFFDPAVVAPVPLPPPPAAVPAGPGPAASLSAERRSAGGDPAVLPASDPRSDAVWPRDDGKSVLSEPIVLDIPSSGRPPAPVVHSVVPLFRWFDEPAADQPFARRRERRSGLRVYLERPWFATGEGELLAVLMAPAPSRPSGDDDVDWVSQWGRDPVWAGRTLPARRIRPLSLEAPDLALGDSSGGHPVTGVVRLSLPLSTDAVPEMVSVEAVGYAPAFNASRGLWFVDVAFEKTPALWPFVRLAVARYQPVSLDGLHLSTAVRADFAQLPPERTLTVSRTDDRGIRVLVSGAAERYDPAVVRERRRTMSVSLERYDRSIGGDLGWTTVAHTPMGAWGSRSADRQPPGDLIWGAELTAPEVLPLRRPLARDAGAPDAAPESPWRVRVREWEEFAGDPEIPSDEAGYPANAVWERRLVYTDEVLL